MRSRRSTPYTIAVTLLLAMSASIRGEDLFRDQVATTLQRRCLACHNNNESKGDLSFQDPTALVEGGHIEPGDADLSHLVELITPVNGAASMPKDAPPLSTQEVAAIRKWIDQGAMWPEGFVLEEPRVTDFGWWSYQPIRRPDVPRQDSSWVRTPIDHFVLEKLRTQALSPSPEADRRTLIRRLTYDLLGLPPTPEATRAFIADPDPLAYEKLVDRLLASEHYGERWARHWLDVVKYADTCGYDKDKLRPNAWPYRDYVIRSLNEDKPYARFVQEQLAGDVLFPGEPDGILGLGFIAAGPWDFIGHVEVAEAKIDGQVARNLDRDDMVANTLNTFCSVTIQCARCHNHKFDPITQEHYYGLQSVFAAVDRAERSYDLDPAIERRRRDLMAREQELAAQLADLDKELAEAGGPALEALNLRIAALEKQVKVDKDVAFGFHSQIVKQASDSKWVQVDLGKPMDIAAIVLHASHDDYAGIGAGFGFPVRFRVEVAKGDEWTLVFDQTQSDFPNPGLIPVRADNLKVRGQRVRVTATKLVERQNDYILALAELEILDPEGTNQALGAAVTSVDSIEAPDRWSRKHLTDGKWPRPENQDLADELRNAKREHAAILAKIRTPERMERRESARKDLKTLRETLAALPSGKLVYAAATHFKPQGNFKPTEGKLRAIHVLHRGNVQQPSKEAEPSMLPLAQGTDPRISKDLDEAARRARLAKWLTDRDHPLVWRSIVNRLWQYHFGQGIVATPNDFGRMGALPTHPELLDWLAVEFRDGGQSMKELHRLIVNSSVYRQTSMHDASKARIDGSNQFLWRMNRRRLEAEEIRDSVLAVSGALNTKMGGPGFYLFVLEKTAHSPHYEYHKFDPREEASHRRSIYRFIVRSQPDPWMTTLDCADSSQSTPKRTETLTSLQALSLFNNKFNLVMAERFSDRLEVEADSLPARVDRAMQLAAQRKPTSKERVDLLAYAKQHGLTNLCRVLFNLSEFVYVD